MAVLRPAVLMIALIGWSLTRAQGLHLAVDLAVDGGAVTFVDGVVAPGGAINLLGTLADAPATAFQVLRVGPDGEPQWARSLGPPGVGFQMTPRRLVQLGDGTLYAFGTYTDAQAFHYFVSRMDTLGNAAWLRTYRPATAGVDYGFSSLVATSDDQLVMTMGFIDRTVALRLDTAGTVLWANEYITETSPTNKNPGFDMAATSDGGVLLTQKAGDDIFLVRLQADGNVAWAFRHPNGGYCHPHAAISLADGGFLIAGSRDGVPFAARLSASGEMLWQKDHAVDEGALERFDQAVELGDGSLLLSPSANSTGILAVHLGAGGEGLAAYSIAGQGTARIIGREAGRVVLAGRNQQLVNGVVRSVELLLCSNDVADLGCMQGTCNVVATALPVQAPVPGCAVVPREILVGTRGLDVQAPVPALRALCDNAVPANAAADDGVRLCPTVIHAGDPVELCSGAPLDAGRLRHWGGDGRLIPLAWNGHVLDTHGWTPGLHLLQVLAPAGGARHVLRVVVR